MYRIFKSSLIRVSSCKSLARNLSTARTVLQAKASICDNVVFVGNTKDENQLVFVFNYNNTHKKKRIQFVRPIDNSIKESLNRMKLKLIKKIPTDGDDILLKLIDSTHGEEVTEATWQDLIPKISSIRMQLQNDEYQFVHNYPIVEDIELPAVALVGFDLYPTKLVINSGDKSNCVFKWYRRPKRKGKWVECNLGNKFFYPCTENDLDHRIKVVCETHYNGNITSRIESDSTDIVKKLGTGAIDKRHTHTTKLLLDHQFRILSYNLLADFYARTEYSRESLFAYCQPEYLDSEYRSKLKRKELLGYKSDIFCLQEVDEQFFAHDLTTTFKEINLNGIYRKKFATDEGLAIFFNTNKFR